MSRINLAVNSKIIIDIEFSIGKCYKAISHHCTH